MGNVNFKPSEEFLDKANKLFKEQKMRILSVIPNAKIEHIGSTAIAGSVTKGDLDINVRVPIDDFNDAISKLKGLYEINQPENWNEGFASFKNDALDLGVQLTVVGSKADDFVKLRDILINNPALAAEYNQMKQKCEGQDMDEYRKAKADFFQKLRELPK